MKALMDLDGRPIDVVGEIAPDCSRRVLYRLRDMIASTLRSQGLTARQIGVVLGLEERQVRRIVGGVPEWQKGRCQEILDGAVGESLD